MNVEALKDAIAPVLKDPSLLPKIGPDGEVLATYCNFATQKIGAALGFTELAGKMANEIYDFIARDPRWMKVSAEQAADYAMRGGWALAAQKEATHGHVATLYPAPMGESPSLGKLVPELANVGKKNGVMLASAAFPVKKTVDGKEVPNEPDYYIRHEA